MVVYIYILDGLVGPRGDRESELRRIKELAVARQERIILAKMIETARAVSGPAATIAALFEGEYPEVIKTTRHVY